MDLLQMQMKALGLPIPEKEYRFHPKRRFRFDWAFVANMLGVEQDGGVWVRGRHSRGAGQIKDMEKLNAASILRWWVLRFTPQQVEKGEAALTIQRWFDERRKDETNGRKT